MAAEAVGAFFSSSSELLAMPPALSWEPVKANSTLEYAPT